MYILTVLNLNEGESEIEKDLEADNFAEPETDKETSLPEQEISLPEEEVSIPQEKTTETEVLDQKQQKRANIIGEILSTEETYISNLQILVERFLIPIEEGKILSPSSIQTIFSCIKTIYKLNSTFLEALKKSAEETEEKEYHIAETFTKFDQSFKLYTSNFQNK